MRDRKPSFLSHIFKGSTPMSTHAIGSRRFTTHSGDWSRLSITPTHARYYAELLGLPPGVPVVARQVGPLDDVDPRLVGVFWNILGLQIHPTREVPPYPA